MTFLRRYWLALVVGLLFVAAVIARAIDALKKTVTTPSVKPVVEVAGAIEEIRTTTKAEIAAIDNGTKEAKEELEAIKKVPSKEARLQLLANFANARGKKK